MKALKETNKLIPISAIILTYLIVKVIYKLTGFHYDFDDGILNMSFLIDIVLWGLVYLAVLVLLKRLFTKST